MWGGTLLEGRFPMGRGRARIRKFLATRERIPTHPPVGKNLVQEHPFSLMMIQKAIKYKGNTIKMIIQETRVPSNGIDTQKIFIKI